MKANWVDKRLGNEATAVRECRARREMTCWGHFDALKFAAWFLNFQIREGNLKGGAQ